MKKIYADNRMTLDIGRQGENLARQIIFDLSDWMAEYGLGVAELIAQRPGEEAPYPVAVRREDTFVLWDLTSADTAVAGSYGRCELRWYVGQVLVKSRIWRTWVEPAMATPGDTPPEPEQGWVNKVLEAGTSAKEAAERAEEAAKKAESAVPAGSLSIGDGLKWAADGKLTVDTADKVEQDNTKPVTSAAVHTELGNIEALLAAL